VKTLGIFFPLFFILIYQSYLEFNFYFCINVHNTVNELAKKEEAEIFAKW